MQKTQYFVCIMQAGKFLKHLKRQAGKKDLFLHNKFLDRIHKNKYTINHTRKEVDRAVK